MTLALCLVSLWWMRRIHSAYSTPAEDGGSNRNEVGQSVL